MTSENFRMVSSKSALLAIAGVESRKPEVGEIVYIQDEDKLYIATERGYEPYAPAVADDSGLKMSLYDLNKAVIQQLPVLDKDQLEECIKNINRWHCEVENKFYMLYGKEINYFTIFHITGVFEDDLSTVGEAVLDCLDNIGDVCSIELTEDKSGFEIWVNVDDMPTCLYLFPYDAGVVRVWM